MVSNQMNNEERNLRERQDEFIDDDADAYEEGDVTGFMEHKFLPGSGINSFNVSFLCFSLLRCASAQCSVKTKPNVRTVDAIPAIFTAASNSWSQNG